MVSKLEWNDHGVYNVMELNGRKEDVICQEMRRQGGNINFIMEYYNPKQIAYPCSVLLSVVWVRDD